MTPTEKDHQKAIDLYCHTIAFAGSREIVVALTQALATAREEGRKEVRDEWENWEIRRNG